MMRDQKRVTATATAAVPAVVAVMFSEAWELLPYELFLGLQIKQFTKAKSLIGSVVLIHIL